MADSLTYKPLPTSLAEAQEYESNVAVQRSLQTHPTLGVWGGVVCLLCTIINIFLVLIAPLPTTPAVAITNYNLHLLRRPSQYIGLADIPRPSLIPRQFNNYPIVVAQVDAAHKDKTIETDLRRYMSHAGTISPEDRNVHVTRTISTIFQFRVIDFGMESCELNLLVRLNDSTSAVVASARPMALALFRLNESVPLNPRTLSYSMRPARVAKVANILINPDQEIQWHRKFSCLTDEVMTFELSCSDTEDEGDCSMTWSQDKEDPASGLYMIQHSTV